MKNFCVGCSSSKALKRQIECSITSSKSKTTKRTVQKKNRKRKSSSTAADVVKQLPVDPVRGRKLKLGHEFKMQKEVCNIEIQFSKRYRINDTV